MTKTLQEIQEYNRRKIICAVHETEDYEKALKHELVGGCSLLIGEQYGASKFTITGSWYGGCDYTGESFDIYCALRENGLKFEQDFFKFSYKTKKFNRKIEIIGKPLTLDRVLLALGKLETDVSVCCYGTIRIGHQIVNLPRWDLTKPTLEKQSEETQRAIYELLGGGND